MSAVLASTACFHCGLPISGAGDWTVRIDGMDRALCCPGCQAVADAIVASGCTDYYQQRDAFAQTGADAALVPPQVALYDADPQFSAAPGGSVDAVFSVDGIRCAACVWLIERSLSRVPGVQAVAMNVATERLHVRWVPALCKPSIIIGTMRRIGYAAYPYEAQRQVQHQERARKKLFRQLFVAGLAMMQVMMYAFPAYVADEGAIEADMAALMQWASLLLTVPAVLYSAQPFFVGAWNSVRQRALGMDVPVALGIAAAFVASVAATVRGAGEVYFDSVTMFIFLLLASRYLEQVARRSASRMLEKLQHALPAAARRLAAYPHSRETAMVGADALAEGDFMAVAPGEPVAADGVIVEGETTLDMALLTGESAPQQRGKGAQVAGGAINCDQPIVVRVSRAAGDSTMARLVRLVEGAGAGKPALAQWADRAAAWFVAALLVLALLVFIAWQLVDPARAWPVAIAVLVVSCPCALSLATPSTLAAATSLLVGRGALVVKPHVLETLHRATHIIFDKTGTLTEGRLQLQAIDTLADVPARYCQRVAAALESASVHPVAEALRRGAGLPSLQASRLRSVAGQGIEGEIAGVVYRVGSRTFVAPGTLPAADGDAGSVFLGTEDKLLARFAVADSVREDAAAVVRYFEQRGQRVILLSGDTQAAASRVAKVLGIDTAIGAQLPHEKLQFVQKLQQDGAIVAMVGDGLNDAAVLGAADVSFAMGGGAALAQLHADCVLMSGRLASLRDAALTADRALRVVRQNLCWATVYNAVAIPAAAFGLVSPWVSAAGMSLSSAVVVINGLRLRRWSS